MLNTAPFLSIVPSTLLMPVGAAIAYTTGGVFMQLSEGLTRPLQSLMVYFLFAIGASLQTVATRHAGMGLTYILVLGLEAVLAVVFSAFFLKEGYSVLKLAGIVMVTLGVVLLRSGNP